MTAAQIRAVFWNIIATWESRQSIAPPPPLELFTNRSRLGAGRRYARENSRRYRRLQTLPPVRSQEQIVFGSGNETSPLVFVGEGPGADEDEQGLPFVGPGRTIAHADD